KCPVLAFDEKKIIEVLESKCPVLAFDEKKIIEVLESKCPVLAFDEKKINARFWHLTKKKS
ncbi:hypothetical protein KS419_20815, partial [Bacillus tamaricis]